MQGIKAVDAKLLTKNFTYLFENTDLFSTFNLFYLFKD